MKHLIAIPLNILLAALCRIQIWLAVFGKSSFLTYEQDLHVGKGARLWVPNRLTIGHCVYIGKQVQIEGYCRAGNY